MSDEEGPDNVLFRLYRRYIGEPETETDVYLGFGLFFAGVLFAVFGLTLFLAGAGLYGLRTSEYFVLAQPGYVLGMLAVPVALVGVVVLLPTKRRVVLTAVGGLAVTGVAAAVFVQAYPSNWFEFGPRYTLAVVAIYAVGVGGIIAATGAALVAQQLEQATAPVPSEIQPATDEPDETISDAQVRADIEDAMANVELTWGGVEKPEGRRLQLTADYATDAIDQVNVAADRTVKKGGVDGQVAGLKQLKGGERNVALSKSTVDDQTAALNALKEQKRRDEVPADAPVRQRGLLGKLLGRLGFG